MQAEVAEDLEYDLILVRKAAAEANFGFESLAVGKMLSNSTVCYREIAHEWANRCGKLHCCLKKLPQPPAFSTATLSVSSRLYGGTTLHQQADYDSLKAQMTGGIFFGNKAFVN